MPPIRPKLSITLPRNFTFHYADGPSTPEENRNPAPTRRSPTRSYRLRPRYQATQSSSVSVDQPLHSLFQQHSSIPNIDIAAPEMAGPPPRLETSVSEPMLDGFLAPIPVHGVVSPRTPTPRAYASFDRSLSHNPAWEQKGELHPAESISRPLSACSVMSDSSESSSASSSSFPSLGDSCTSPESDAADPFSYPTAKGKGKQRNPRTAPTSVQLNQRKRARKSRQVAWTEDMDLHLWATYLMYLQDPTVTPFRMNPGSVPPLGVCCRVAREAKRSWRGSRLASGLAAAASKARRGRTGLRDVHDESNAVKTTELPDGESDCKSGSVTPTGPEAPKLYLKWPTSESATRRRLRELCKRKGAPSTQHQRMLQTRSPAPANRPAAPLASPVLGFRASPTFSTREINISLTASTSDSMRPNCALASLTRDVSTNQQDQEHWFGQPLLPLHQPVAQPVVQGLGIGGLEGAHTFPRLGSPFPGRTHARPSILEAAHLQPPSLPRTRSDSATIPGPALRSPVQFGAPLPQPSAPKRRALHQLEEEMSPGGTEKSHNLLEELFGAPADSSHRRVRSRGFSLGDVCEGSRLSSLITPPTIYDQMNSSEFQSLISPDEPSPHGSLAPPKPDRTLRLGSPFGGDEPSHRQQHPSSHFIGRDARSTTNTTNSYPRRSPPIGFNIPFSIEGVLGSSDWNDRYRKHSVG